MILAAGQGKRMRSNLPKVLHEIGGKPLLYHVLSAVGAAKQGVDVSQVPVAIVVGHQREAVEKFVQEDPVLSLMDITFVHQPEQRGTGHAARFAMDSEWGEQRVKEKAAVLVLPGDLPLISPSLIEQMSSPLGRGDALKLLTCDLPDPTGYGRVVRRGKQGSVMRIVEEKDATMREKAIREVALSIYLFDAAFLQVGLRKISNKNSQAEYYLTDLISQAAARRKKINVLKWADHEDLRGVNDPWELALAGRILNERVLRSWAMKGVLFVDPWTVRIDSSVILSEGVVLHPGVILTGTTEIAAGSELGPNVVLKNVQVGQGVKIKAGTVAEDSVIGAQTQVGPYAHLRPDSKVGSRAKIGNFVELKKAVIGDGSSVAHLSYLGDAEVGRNVNIGCGFVTCNYDGRVINGQRKHKTIIEDEVFMGSDCQAVAPVRIGKGAFVASGSTITRDVPSGDLAIARSKQVNKTGYAARFRPAPSTPKESKGE